MNAPNHLCLTSSSLSRQDLARAETLLTSMRRSWQQLLWCLESGKHSQLQSLFADGHTEMIHVVWGTPRQCFGKHLIQRNESLLSPEETKKHLAVLKVLCLPLQTEVLSTEPNPVLLMARGGTGLPHKHP